MGHMLALWPGWPTASRVYGTLQTASGSLFHFTLGSLTAQIARDVLFHPAVRTAAHGVAAVQERMQESFFIDLFS
jgi:hypothetical protein